MAQLLQIVAAIVLLALTTVADAATSQCKYQENSADKFTKIKTVRTKWNPLLNPWSEAFRDHSAFISIKSIGDELQLQIKIDSPRRSNAEPSDEELQHTYVISVGALVLGHI